MADNGLDILIGCAGFMALLMMLGVLVLNVRADRAEEAGGGPDRPRAEEPRA